MTVKPTEFRAHLYSYLDRVALKGESIEMMRKGKRILIHLMPLKVSKKDRLALIPKRKTFSTSNEEIETPWDWNEPEILNKKSFRNRAKS
ncbi:MAG: hypothetical protein V4507_01605 [Verrucomicrobiota bacterium]